MNRIILIIVFLNLTGCESLLFEDDPVNDPEANFEVFWYEFKRHYTFFELKGIDWDSVYATNRPRIHPGSTNSDLLDLLSKIVLSFKDGHTRILANNQYIFFDFKKGHPLNSPLNPSLYLEDIQTINEELSYALIRNSNLAYVRIESFGGQIENFKEIDTILGSLEHTDGLIIDIRGNGGGSDSNSDLIASRFADKKRLYKKFKYRSGSGYNEFTSWFDDFIKPEGKSRYEKPVVLITNRGTYSAAEDFVLAMMSFPQVTTLGDTTGGGSGNPLLRELPNGWIFQLSAWYPVTPDLVPYEGTGLVPDFPVWISEEDSINGVDTILKSAIELLQ